MSQNNFEELGSQGNSEAISTLLNRTFEAKGITVKAAIKNDSLHVIVEASQTPNQAESVTLIKELVSRIKPQSIETVTIYGRQIGDDIPDWHQNFSVLDSAGIANSQTQTSEPFSFSSFAKMIAGIGESIGNTTSQAGKAIVDTASGVGDVVGKTTLATGHVFVDTAFGVASAVTDTVVHTGKAVVDTVVGVGGVIGNNASQTGQSLLKTATGVGGTAAKHSYQVLSQITDFVAGTPILRTMVNQVDLAKVEESVKTLKQKYPQETPRQIAHRLMLEKAIYAGSSGLLTSLVPGQAAALFVVDLTTTSALQAEMVYQIAAAYALDLQDPVRKGEVLTIFGLALGGNRAIKAGLELLQNAPVAGAVIGASSNAVMLYTVGYAACRFYEAKLNQDATEASLVASKEASEEYLKMAIAQQIIMDQILIHVICAGNPGKSWEDIVSELETLNISPASLAVIQTNIKSPPSLEQLLTQINRDFALPLLDQCERVVQRDGVKTPEEALVIDKISQQFGLDLNNMKTQMALS